MRQGATLIDAREARELVKSLLADGHDPVQQRAASKQQGEAEGQSLFSALMESWLAKQKKEWSAIHLRKSREASERDILPHLGRYPASTVTPMIRRESTRARQFVRNYRNDDTREGDPHSLSCRNSAIYCEGPSQRMQRRQYVSRSGCSPSPLRERAT